MNEWGDKVNEGILRVKVIPKASRSEVVGWEGDTLRVRIAALPEKGKANQELLRTLAKWLGVPRSSLTLISGDTSCLKRVRISYEGR